jgi:hypothetical protein
MILLTFLQDGIESLGVKTAEGILDVGAANQSLNIAAVLTDPAAFFAAGLSVLPMLDEFVKQVNSPKG